MKAPAIPTVFELELGERLGTIYVTQDESISLGEIADFYPNNQLDIHQSIPDGFLGILAFDENRFHSWVFLKKGRLRRNHEKRERGKAETRAEG